MKKTRKELITDLINEYTAFYVNEGTFTFDMCNAEDIALSLELDRSNVSRILNQMHTDFELIKVKGRPTLFLSKDVLQNDFNYTNIPQEINSSENLMELFVDNTSHKSVRISSELNVVGNAPDGTMYEIINKVVPAILFPQKSFNVIVLDGIQGSGRKEFCRELFDYGKKNSRFSRKEKMYFLNYLDIINVKSEAIYRLCEDDVAMFVIKIDQEISFESIDQFTNIVSNIYTNASKVLPSLVFITDEKLQKNQSFFKKYTPYYVKYPGYKDRNAKEMIELILLEIQKIVDGLDIRIRVTNDTIMKLIETEYDYGIQQMLNELAAAITYLSYLNRSIHSKVLYLSHDLLRSDVYLNIREEGYFLDTARKIVFDVLPEIVDFIPNREPEVFEILDSLFQGSKLVLDVPKRTILQQVRLDVLNISPSILLEIDPRYDRFNLILSYLFQKTSIRDDVPILNNLYSLLEQMINDTYIPNHSRDDMRFKEDEQSRTISDALIKIIESKYSVTMKQIHVYYIRNYIYFALTLTPSNKTNVLILTNKVEFSNRYALYLNNKLENRICYSIGLDQISDIHKNNEKKYIESVCKAVMRADKRKSLILMSDVKLTNKQEVEITSKTDSLVVTVYGVNLTIIDEVSKYMNAASINLTLLLYNTIKKINSLNTFLDSSSLNLASERIGYDLLTTHFNQFFTSVNISRSNEVFYHTFSEVCYQLGIEKRNRELIEFIFVMNMAIQNINRKENVNMIDIDVIRNKHNFEFQTIKKVLKKQKELLGYVIDDSEVALLTYIFTQE